MSGPQNLQSTALHDVELAGFASAGDRRAFGELVRRHGSSVRGLLRRMGAQGAEADDVAQDAFLMAFEAIADFRGQGSFAGWVKKIAVRHYLRRLAKERRLAALVAEAEWDEITSTSIDTAGHIDLDEALKTLAQPERLCVTMCYAAGLSHAEASDALNLPLGTVKSHVKRGLEKLRTRLAPPDGVVVQGSQAHG